MTTPLVKPVSREILVGSTAYIVTLAPDHLSIRRKGTRTGRDVTWDALLTFGESAVPVAEASDRRDGGLPRAVLDEIAREVRAAAAALGRADDGLTQAGALPALLMVRIHGDPEYGRPVQADHWFVEPLLTVAEVAQLLRVSTRAVRRLGLRTIRVGGEERYRQVDLREYLRSLAEPSLGRSRPRRP